MSHGPEHHIEEAEHATHAARDPFDRRVVMTVAIVAAVLACVTLFGHRAHNDTLRLQGDALRLQSESGSLHTQASNMWAFYQAQNIREHQYRALTDLVELIPTRDDARKQQEKTVGDWKRQVQKYAKNLPDIKAKAEDFDKKSDQYHHQAGEKLAESHHAHTLANRLDFGELGVEISLVLCSLAVLTRRRGFWYVGLACCLVGVLVALSGLLGLGIAASGHH